MTVFWSLQQISARVGDMNLANPGSVLGLSEQEMYRRFRIPKRQQEWLGGRLAIKQLARSVNPQLADLPDSQLEILNEPTGVPFLQVKGVKWETGVISLSHSHDFVFCMFSDQKKLLGADLEWIERRGPEFSADYFTPNEIAQLDGLPEDERALLETLIWSSKEAVMKALATGLRVDTRKVDILVCGNEKDETGWITAQIHSELVKENSLHLFWRREGNFILTACMEAGFSGQLTRVD